MNDLSIKSVVKSTLRFNLYNLISRFFAIPKGIIVATLIIPEEYGIINLISLIMFYMTMLVPGFTTVAFRRIPGLYSKCEFASIKEIQDKTFFADITISIFYSLLVIIYSIFLEDLRIQVGLLILSISFILSRYTFFFRNYSMAIQEFKVAANGGLIENVLPVFIVLSSIFWMGLYSVFIADIITLVVLMFYYLKKLKLKINIQFDFRFLKQVFIESIVLQGQTITFWVTKMLDRTFVSYFFPLDRFGIYSFASNYMTQAQTFLNQLGQVLQPIFWANSEKADDKRYAFSTAIRFSIFLSFISSLIVPIVQAIMLYITFVLMRNYVSAIPIFNLLTLYIPVLTIVTIPNLILNSTIVNKQNLSLFVWLNGLIFGVLIIFIAFKINHSLELIAITVVINQFFITTINFMLIRKYLPPEQKNNHLIFLPIIFPILLATILTIFFSLIIDINSLVIIPPDYLSKFDKLFYLLSNSFEVAKISVIYFLSGITLFSISYFVYYKKYFSLNLRSLYK